MRKITPTTRKRDQPQTRSTLFTSRQVLKALTCVSKHGLSPEKLRHRLRLPSLLEVDKLTFHLQSTFPRRLKKSLQDFRDKQFCSSNQNKWEYSSKKPIQSLEYYLTL